MKVRYYTDTDYEEVVALYNNQSTFGGQYDDARDSRTRLGLFSKSKKDCILVAILDTKVVGCVTVFEDGRTAWLSRFAVWPEHEAEATQVLFEGAVATLKERGHTQVLVYAPAGNSSFEKRYTTIGFKKGGDFTAYWQDI